MPREMERKCSSLSEIILIPFFRTVL